MKKETDIKSILKRLEKLEKEKNVPPQQNKGMETMQKEGVQMLSYQCIGEFLAKYETLSLGSSFFHERLRTLQEHCKNEEEKMNAFTMNYFLKNEPAFRMAVVSLYFHVCNELKSMKTGSK
jgi:hypothetical protein